MSLSALPLVRGGVGSCPQVTDPCLVANGVDRIPAVARAVVGQDALDADLVPIEEPQCPLEEATGC
jgi:hypothetical protein